MAYYWDDYSANDMVEKTLRVLINNTKNKNI